MSKQKNSFEEIYKTSTLEMSSIVKLPTFRISKFLPYHGKSCLSKAPCDENLVTEEAVILVSKVKLEINAGFLPSRVWLVEVHPR